MSYCSSLYWWISLLVVIILSLFDELLKGLVRCQVYYTELIELIFIHLFIFILYDLLLNCWCYFLSFFLVYRFSFVNVIFFGILFNIFFLIFEFYMIEFPAIPWMPAWIMILYYFVFYFLYYFLDFYIIYYILILFMLVVNAAILISSFYTPYYSSTPVTLFYVLLCFSYCVII